MARGRLRIYLGAAPGVGKTFAMLNEGQRRKERGTDVVVAFVETHGRKHTADAIAELEVVARREMTYRGASFTEMDVAAVIARQPDLALVDEYAHTNVPGSKNEKRWQDVAEILDAGIDVVTTVNIQHLESINDVVEQITGIVQRETIPDSVVRKADQVELVDMSPEALRRRLAHGNVYAADKIDAALANYFRVGNLTALRELALLWLADKVEEGLQLYRREHGIATPWETRERIVVALAGGPEGAAVVRRAARIAERAVGAELFAVHVSHDDGLADSSPVLLEEDRRLVEALGGSFFQVVSDDVARSLVTFAHDVNASQLVLGATRMSSWRKFITGNDIAGTVVRLAGDLDVHLVPHEHAAGGRTRLPRPRFGLSWRRQVLGFVVAVLGLVALTALLANTRDAFNYSSQILLYLAVVVIVALIGGVLPAVCAAIGAAGLLNWYFTPPLYTWTIAQRDNLITLVAFVAIGVAVSVVIEMADRRATQAARAGAEARVLGALARDVLLGTVEVGQLLERLRFVLNLDGATLLERTARDGETSRSAWTVVGVAGDESGSPNEGSASVSVSDGLVLAVRGRRLTTDEQRILRAMAATVGLAYERHELQAAIAEAAPLAEVDKVRTALLRAVSHDLRSPLASAKAAVTSLRSTDVDWTTDERAELLETADLSLDRLTSLVSDLLDLSRLQAGALSIMSRTTHVDEVVALALDEVTGERGVRVSIPLDLPAVHADPALLQRVLANLVDNAMRFSPASKPPRITAGQVDNYVEIRVMDQGPGVPTHQQDAIFAPFQRLGDAPSGAGTGLGLALARGFVEAMHGTLSPEDTPGGGLTMVVTLPIDLTTTEPVAPTDAFAASAEDGLL
jgi:two-component system sensor histidine kinase KdpD